MLTAFYIAIFLGVFGIVGAVLFGLRLKVAQATLMKLSVSEASLQAQVVAKTSALEKEQADAASQAETLQLLRVQQQESLRQLAEAQATLKQVNLAQSEKITLLENTKTEMSRLFKDTAQKLFDEKATQWNQQGKTALENLLKPLGTNITNFEKTVRDTYEKETRDRVALSHEIRTLKGLNQQISEDAVKLTQALKGETKVQGMWGEMVLGRVLENSGLREGEEYSVQRSISTDAGKRFQPDVIINLPENKVVIVDAKVSLTAYERFCTDDDAEERSRALKQHVNSISQHVKRLSDKSYQNLAELNSLDFVLMFVPIEAALGVALTEDQSLLQQALNKNIVIVTPATLLATLRTIENLWRYEHQNQHALKIADSAGKMYDKLVAFVADLEDVGRKLNAGQRAYENAFNKLSSGKGNLISRAEKIKALGARASKKMPASVEELVELEAPESEDA